MWENCDISKTSLTRQEAQSDKFLTNFQVIQTCLKETEMREKFLPKLSVVNIYHS